MTRINTNVLSLMAQRNLMTAGLDLGRSLERLSTGLRINRASDDPAGLVASERLRSEIVSLAAARSNTARAANMIGTADAGLEEISGLLLDIQSLVTEAANAGGMTAEETAASQAMIDEAITSIDRIAATTQFNGRKLLDGTCGFQTHGVTTAELSSVLVNEALFSGAQKTVTYNIDATTAQKAGVTMDAGDIASADGTVRVTGNKGVASVDFTAGMTQQQVIDAVNAVSADTGVTAAAQGGDIAFQSAEYGDQQFVSFTRLSGATFTLSADEDYGADATVTSVDGSASGITVEGLGVHVQRAGLDVEMTIADDTVVQAAGTFQIDSGGLTFQIAPQIGPTGQVNVGIRSMDSNTLGDNVVGYLRSLFSGGENDLASGNFTTAEDVVEKARSQAVSLRGRLGALQQNAFEAAQRSLTQTQNYLTGAESSIRDTDYAAEAATLIRNQILLQAGLHALAYANAVPQNVLALLE